jgi:hypothetical protein
VHIWGFDQRMGGRRSGRWEMMHTFVVGFGAFPTRYSNGS